MPCLRGVLPFQPQNSPACCLTPSTAIRASRPAALSGSVARRLLRRCGASPFTTVRQAPPLRWLPRSAAARPRWRLRSAGSCSWRTWTISSGRPRWVRVPRPGLGPGRVRRWRWGVGGDSSSRPGRGREAAQRGKGRRGRGRRFHTSNDRIILGGKAPQERPVQPLTHP